MALAGVALFLLGCGLAGVAIAPWFNAFLPPERRRSTAGCWWILATGLCWWLAGWCFFNVPSIDSQTGQPVDEMVVMNSFDGVTTDTSTQETHLCGTQTGDTYAC